MRRSNFDDRISLLNVHNLLTIVLNSKHYGICFVDVEFRPHSNAIIGKLVVDVLLKQVEHDEFLTEIVQQQKNFNEWNDIWMSSNDSSKLIDIFVQLTIPIEIFAQFVYNKSTIRFLAEVIQRIMQALDILQHLPLVCDKLSTIQGY